MISQTSLESYEILEYEGKLNSQQLSFLTVLKRREPATDRELASVLKWFPSQVAARRNELIKEGLVQESGRKYDIITKRNVTTWKRTKGAYII